MHPAQILRPKSTFLTIPILVAGTNSVSSGNILDESFFDKYFAEKLKVPFVTATRMGIARKVLFRS
jgi:hypothetical protein